MKEGRATIRLDEETGWLPVISPNSRDKEENDSVLVSNQVVINMTMKDWEVFGKQICVL